MSEHAPTEPLASEEAGLPRLTLATVAAGTSAAAIASSLLAMIGVTSYGSAVVRFCVLLAFVCTAPGTVLLALLEPDRPRFSSAMVLASGLALGAVAAQLLLLVGFWYPNTALAAAGVGCLVVLVRREILE